MNDTNAMTPTSRLWRLAPLLLALSACAVGPDYRRPPVDVSTHFKQMDGWKEATPADARIGGAWWLGYADPELSALLEQVRISNQNVAQYEAAYRKASALVQAADANRYPTLSLSASDTHSGGGTSSSARTRTAEASASWEPDLWGKLRRTLEEDTASAEASRAQLASATLSAQSSLAQDYFQLRVMDEEIRLYQQTVADYTRYLKIIEKQYEVGSSSRATLATAQTQLETARASVLDVQWQRAQMEHAIAVLVGKPPAEFSLAARPLSYTLPAIPVGLPSQLLERRPDVAYAERSMAAANAAIGVARAAYYPDLTLSASGGYSGSGWQSLLTAPNRIWSLGASVSGTVLDFGATRASVSQAEAAYDGQVASYRQTVLSGLQEVENYLVKLHTLEEEIAVQRRAVVAAQESARLSFRQYQAGMINYLNVATTQATSLSQQQSLLSLISSQLVASVELIAALGGGWDGVAETETAARQGM
jgi:NodT family efflux transporter outer membrane factor (OMF) lipoprotein